jgi:hypothetical protein
MPEDKISFIPKKTFERPFYKSRGPGFFLTSSFLLLLLSGLICGGAILYRNSLKKQVDLLSDSLERAKAAFELPLINKLVSTSEKIKTAKVLLAEHKTIVPFFDFLERSTLKDVRFNSFEYSLSKDKEATISMGGTAKSYASLALQAKAFEEEKNIKNVSFSGLNLGDKGAINFKVNLTLDPSFLSFQTK